MAAFKTNANTTRTPREIALEKGTQSSGFESAPELPAPPSKHQPDAPMTEQAKVPVLKPYR